MAGVLYVVATPIGNLEDVTLRALRVLREVDLIAAEDTRRTRTLLERHGIARPLTSYYDAVERTRAPALVERLLDGASVALVSDAGTPRISDPGYHLVRAALAAGIRVVPIPGPSAVTALLSATGFPADRFVFEGFLPTRAGARAARLAELAGEPRALVFFEAARRLGVFLDAAETALGDREVVIGRELTKRHEELIQGRLSELRRQLAARETLRGEVTVVIAGASTPATDSAVDVDAELHAGRAAGRGLRELSADIARRAGLSRRDVYRRALALERERGSPGGPARDPE